MRIKAALDAGEPAIAPRSPAGGAGVRTGRWRARGIRLVLFPVPDKASLQPRELHGRGAGAAELPVAANPDFHRFVAEMRAAGRAGVRRRARRAAAPGEPPRYLVQDTHWTPAWMEEVAGQLAAFVRAARRRCPRSPPPAWTVAAAPIARVGDIVDMLKLPEGQRLFAPQAVTVHQVRDAERRALAARREAPTCCCWATASPTCSRRRRWAGARRPGWRRTWPGRWAAPLDVIAQNDSGAFATRKLLSEALGAGEDRLAGKKVVIWEFAARELAVGDWQPV